MHLSSMHQNVLQVFFLCPCKQPYMLQFFFVVASLPTEYWQKFEVIWFQLPIGYLVIDRIKKKKLCK